MNCPPDYICHVTPAWVALALVGGAFVLVVLLLAFLAYIGRDDR